MDRADELLSALSAGDPATAPAAAKGQPDSPDDFEHLLAGESPQRAASALLAAERRGEPDSGSEGESPLHRRPLESPPPLPAFGTPEPDLLTASEEPPRQPQPAPLTPEPIAPVSLTPEPQPVPLAPEPKHEPEPELPTKPDPKSEREPHKSTPEPPQKLEPTPSKVELPKPEPPKPAAPKPEPPKPAEPPKPVPSQVPPRAPAHVIEAEVIFCQMGLDAWFDPQRLHPEVESLLYWRCPLRSGAALGAGLALLVALAVCSAVSVAAHAALLLLAAAVAFRVYKSIMQAVQKTNEGHPFKALLEADISVGAERAQELAVSATAHLNAASRELRRLFLVEDLVDSLKFGVLLWCLTYVGACFNGITLLILGWIALFTLPKAYEMNKAQVDSNLELARAKINEITAKVRAAVPLGKKSESDKEK